MQNNIIVNIRFKLSPVNSIEFIQIVVFDWNEGGAQIVFEAMKPIG